VPVRKNPASLEGAGFSLGTANAHRGLVYMADERSDREGNEPSPLLLFGVALIPVLAILGWFAFG
jgi:hypothetical protein